MGAESTPILITDFDGVLNRHGGTCAGPFTEPECVAAYNRVIRETGAKIVVCSAWRYLVHNGYMTLPGFATFLRTHGVRGEVIDVTRPSRDDVTPCSFEFNNAVRVPYVDGEPRYMQIADWLKRPLVPYSRYAIVDDDPGAFGGRPGVQTNGATGLTEADADALILLLSA